MNNSKFQVPTTREVPNPKQQTGFLARRELIGHHLGLKLGASLVLGWWGLVLLLALDAHAQPYSIDWSTIDGGGRTSTGGLYSVSGTIGQPDAGGPMTNGQYSVTGGFWALPTTVQTLGAPTLTIVGSLPGFATISWTPNNTNYVLQENLNLATTNWVISPSGATNPIVVPSALLMKFYRLFKP